MTIRTRKNVAFAAAALAGTAMLGTAAAYASNSEILDPGFSVAHAEESATAAGPTDIKIDGLVKPNSELMVLATCPGNDTSATLDSTFDVSTKMGPSADTGQLVGYVTLPNQIGANPMGGAHMLNITCASGGSANVSLDNATNDKPGNDTVENNPAAEDPADHNAAK